jgi:putative ABC transport system permease protein
MWSYYAYILLEEGVSEKDVLASLAKISTEENANEEHTKIYLGLQNINSITPGPDLSNQIGKTTESFVVLILSGFALIVIVSACFNYTNLSIARSLRRAKEVGVRKVIGSSSTQVFYQFILEAIIVALLALIFAIGFFFLLRPAFIAIDNQISDMVTLELNSKILLQFIALAVITGLVAGLLPAILFSRISPNNVLRNSIALSNVQGISLRKILIVVQFVLSIMFILGALIEYKQFKYALNFDLGYQTDNILIIDLQDNDTERVKAELAKMPEVESIAASMMVTSVGSYWANTMKYKDPLDSTSVYYNGVDVNYLPLHGHKLLAGNNFAPLANDTSTLQIIVNEQLIKYFNIGTPEESIGEVVTLGKKEAVIVGVMKDFHYGTLSREVKPFLLKYNKDRFYKLNVKFSPTTNLLAAREKIAQSWKDIDDVHPFEASFYTEELERTYDEFSALVKIIGVLSFLAVTIAALGLLGMVMFTTETRLKEISIRKVLGASENTLVYLLGKGFLLLLVIASVIAVPLTVLIFQKVIFSDVAFHANISILDTLSGPALVIFIGMITTVVITSFAARSNPATILRNE